MTVASRSGHQAQGALMHSCPNELGGFTSNGDELKPPCCAHDYSVFKNSSSESGAPPPRNAASGSCSFASARYEMGSKDWTAENIVVNTRPAGGNQAGPAALMRPTVWHSKSC